MRAGNRARTLPGTANFVKPNQTKGRLNKIHPLFSGKNGPLAASQPTSSPPTTTKIQPGPGARKNCEYCLDEVLETRQSQWLTTGKRLTVKSYQSPSPNKQPDPADRLGMPEIDRSQIGFGNTGSIRAFDPKKK